MPLGKGIRPHPRTYTLIPKAEFVVSLTHRQSSQQVLAVPGSCPQPVRGLSQTPGWVLLSLPISALFSSFSWIFLPYLPFDHWACVPPPVTSCGAAAGSSSSPFSGLGWAGSQLRYTATWGSLQNSAHCSSTRSCFLLLCPVHARDPDRSPGTKQALPGSILWAEVEGKGWSKLGCCLILAPLKQNQIQSEYWWLYKAQCLVCTEKPSCIP